MAGDVAPAGSVQDADRPFSKWAMVAGHLTKSFPGVRALDDVSVSLYAGEIAALLGQNGAGKSTLIQVMSGFHPVGSYSGRIELGGNDYRPTDTATAEQAGVVLVPQEVSVVPQMSVAENICLNAEPTRWGFIDVSLRLAKARSALLDFELDVDPHREMGSLDLATQQLIVIARALSKNLKLLILDEPTAALTERESLRLFDRIRTLKARGVASIFVSHRLSEVFSISDRIIVMRDGHIRGDHVANKVSRADVVAEMLGHARGETQIRPARRAGGSALQVRRLTVFDESAERRVKVDGLSLAVAKGEVVGLFGLLGSGCVEAALAIYGAWRGVVDAEIAVRGDRVSVAGPQQAIALGLGLIAQDRRDALIQDQSVLDNMMMATIAKGVGLRSLDIPERRRLAISLMKTLRIKAESVDAEMRTLSGGNQQKVQIARWLAAGAQILILVDPTRGVDVGARGEINRIWSRLSESGHAILIASSDAEELVDVCHRVIVMRNGRNVGELSGATLNEKELLRMATDG
jgi:ABC-type sugar transport system ATPase subunit